MRSKPERTALARELRRNDTPTERTLWSLLRGRALGVHFRRQHPIAGFIVDFVALRQRVIVEVDGGIHDEQVAYDQARDRVLEGLGFKVVRVKNTDVESCPDLVRSRIVEALQLIPSPADGGGGDWSEAEIK